MNNQHHTGTTRGEVAASHPVAGTQDLFGSHPLVGTSDDPLADYHPGTSTRPWAAPAEPTAASRGRTASEQPLPDDAATTYSTPGYVQTGGGICRITLDKKGEPVTTRLSNWTARIVADVTHDDGGSTPTRTFAIEARQGDRVGTVQVAPEELHRVREWVLNALGATAQIYVSPSVQDHLLLAVQQASVSRLEQRTVFKHSGWTQKAGEWAYLHATGGLGIAGDIASIQVDLPRSLQPLQLPAPSDRAAAAAALTAALELLDLAPRPVMAAVLGAAWRAPLGSSQLAVWVTGPTGAGKTELTAVAQQHFGAGFDAQHLPAAWSGTANSINELAYLAKDMLLTIDDFVPKGPASTVARLHYTAEQVIRAQGNSAGRSRLDSDASLRDNRPPRTTLLASGEDIPQGQSLRGRLLVVDLGPGDLDFARLTLAQAAGRDGTLATATAGYVRWLAAHPERLGSAGRDAENLRIRLLGIGGHKKTATLVSEVALGWRTLLDYAIDCQALTTSAAEALWTQIWSALEQCAASQSAPDADADPALRFLQLIAAALSSGRAHLAATSGSAPMHPQRWGWRDEGAGLIPDWREQGRRIGWIDGEDIYLLPDAAMEIARSDSGEPIAISTSTMAKRLYERKLLQAEELATRQTYTVRKVVQERRQKTWHLRAHDLGAESR